MFVFTVLFSKYFEVHAELCGTRKFMFWNMGRGLKSLGTTALDENILKMSFEKGLRFRLKTFFREQFQNGGKFLFKTFLQKNNAELLYTFCSEDSGVVLRELQT